MEKYLSTKLWVRLQSIFRFIVGKFTLEEDRRLLRLDDGSLLRFFMKNVFPKLELLN